MLLDNVGVGGADARAGLDHRYLGLEGYADDVVAVLAHLGIRDAVVVGHSIGAMIAALATFKAPSRIAALVLVAASPRYLDDEGYPGGLQREDIDAIYAAATSDFERWADRFATSVTGEASGSAMAR